MSVTTPCNTRHPAASGDPGPEVLGPPVARALIAVYANGETRTLLYGERFERCPAQFRIVPDSGAPDAYVDSGDVADAEGAVWVRNLTDFEDVVNPLVEQSAAGTLDYFAPVLGYEDTVVALCLHPFDQDDIDEPVVLVACDDHDGGTRVGANPTQLIAVYGGGDDIALLEIAPGDQAVTVVAEGIVNDDDLGMVMRSYPGDGRAITYIRCITFDQLSAELDQKLSRSNREKGTR